jgi:hypothetical protein
VVAEHSPRKWVELLLYRISGRLQANAYGRYLARTQLALLVQQRSTPCQKEFRIKSNLDRGDDRELGQLNQP